MKKTYEELEQENKELKQRELELLPYADAFDHMQTRAIRAENTEKNNNERQLRVLVRRISTLFVKQGDGSDKRESCYDEGYNKAIDDAINFLTLGSKGSEDILNQGCSKEEENLRVKIKELEGDNKKLEEDRDETNELYLKTLARISGLNVTIEKLNKAYDASQDNCKKYQGKVAMLYEGFDGVLAALIGFESMFNECYWGDSETPLYEDFCKYMDISEEDYESYNASIRREALEDYVMQTVTQQHSDEMKEIVKPFNDEIENLDDLSKGLLQYHNSKILILCQGAIETLRKSLEEDE